jgi:hypothetical protein
MLTAGVPGDPRGYAAVFIDYENVYYHMTGLYADFPELNDYIIDLLMNLHRQLEERFGVRPIITKAYADFERIRSGPQGSLYLMGVDTANVLGTDHKNAADMRLCIDALEVLYTRPEIRCFVIMAGDRDYIPLIQHLKKQAKTVVSVGFVGDFSGDLMLNVGRDNFVDADELFTPERRAKLEEIAVRYNDYLRAEREREEERAAEEAAKERERAAGAADGIAPPDVPPLPSHADAATAAEEQDAGGGGEPVEDTHFNPILNDVSPEERICLEVMIRNYGHHAEVYLAPFLRKLTDALPALADWERKMLLSNLEYKGAIRTARRKAKPNDYTVAVLNHDHPAVREAY